MGARPLDGLTILVTRPEDRAPKLKGALEALGAGVVVAPTIAVRPVSLDEENAFTAAWADRGSFDWLVVVSPTIAQLIVALVARDGLEGLPAFAAVGPATTQGLREAGIEVALQPDAATGLDLARTVGAESLVGGSRVLWPMADMGRQDGVELLREAGLEVVAPVAYSTVPLKPATEAVDRADLVLLASPSAVAGYVLGESEQRGSLPAIAIGPTTAAAVTAAGLPLAGVADPHTSDGLVQAVLAWAATR